MRYNEIPSEEFFYVVHGIIPELLAHVAYRRASKVNTENRKIIRCPYCGGRLTDVGDSVKVELYRNPTKTRHKCHGYIKCQTCKDEVGMIMSL